MNVCAWTRIYIHYDYNCDQIRWFSYWYNLSVSTIWNINSFVSSTRVRSGTRIAPYKEAREFRRKHRSKDESVQQRHRDIPESYGRYPRRQEHACVDRQVRSASTGRITVRTSALGMSALSSAYEIPKIRKVQWFCYRPWTIWELRFRM